MSKVGLALIAITAISVAVVAVQASSSFFSYYFIQAADAQVRLPNNSVRSENIVDGQVKTQDLANDAVTTEKIKNGEVQTEDIASGAIEPDVQIVRGNGNENPFPPNSSGGDRVDCPSGTILTGGGFVSGSFNTQVIRSFPVDADTWQVDALNVGTQTTWVQAYALCMAPSP